MENQPFYRDTWAEVDLDAIRDNVSSFACHVQSGTKVMAVVKANAYGHGAVEVAKAALEAGADRLAVALLDEAILLREAGITAPILVLGWIRPSDADVALQYDVALTVFQENWLKAVLRLGAKGLKLHLEIDTGMSRLGIRDRGEAERVLQLFKENADAFTLEGVYTHFATADSLDSPIFFRQQEIFRDWLFWIAGQGVKPSIIHTSNSAAATRVPFDSYDYIRLGISMYGLKPSEEIETPFELKPAFSLHSRLVHVKELMPGDTISYGATYTVKEREWIGTIPIGYADGWIRRLKTAKVLIDGEYAPIVGRICMDQCMVRLPKQLPIGTKVTLIGKQGNKEITMDDIASQLETINYEIPCNITSRVPRIYKKRADV
ncbi:alanine racemase [Pueribacillus theae]|uniref:Alanine racemase n=1 Tax=Pueribacillus theae TaxID=2171751 RepID=A0A2U1JP82_9BACI|nr:alanine racemase [Pueribacillus theae]PWA06986.1 alanine racemase [Pueribacillus theae]